MYHGCTWKREPTIHFIIFLPKRRQQAEEERERNTVPVPNDTDSPDYELDHLLWSDSDDDSCSVATSTTDSTEASCEAT